MHVEAHACNIRCIVVHWTNQRLWCVKVTVCCIIFVILLFAVKDGYNNLFAGNCTRYNRTYNTYGDGRWVSSLNNTKNCIQQFLCFVFVCFFKKKLQFFCLFFGCLSVQEEFRTLLLRIADRICRHTVTAANRTLT